MVAKFGFCYATEQNIQDLRNAVRFGKEDFPYADTINSEIPSLHTFIDSSYRFGIVRIGSKGILVPLPFITQEDFKNLCEVGPPSQARGKIFKNPCSFIAEVDLSGRINREIVEQA